MQKTSGLVLDYYDDAAGSILKDIEGGQEMAKVAHQLTAEERNNLPDDVFALVAFDGDVALKKFAAVDRGNTQLSIGYFLKTGHVLPAAAQKVAAMNLVKACGWYGLEPPEQLQKIAFGALGLLGAGLVLPGAAGEAKRNLQAVKGSGGTIMTPQQIQAARAVRQG